MADESKHDFLGRSDVDTIGDFLKRHELADDAVDMVQDRTTLFNSDAHSDLPVFYITACDVAVQDYLSAGHPLREAADRAGAITAAAQTTKKAPNRHGKDASQLHSSSSTFGRNPRSRSKPKRSARLHANEVPLALQHQAFRTFRETVTAGLDAVPIDFVATVEALSDNAVNKFDTEGKREDAVYPRLSDVLTWGTAGDVLTFKGEQTSEVKTAVTVTTAAGKQHKVVAAGFRTDAHVGTSAVVARSCIRPALSLTQCRPYATRAAHATGGHVLAYVETKNELSSSGSAMDQLSAYYFQHVAWNHGKQGDMPLFLVAVSGPFIQVSGGLTRSHPQIDELTDIHRLVQRTYSPAGFEKSVAMLWALRQALVVLASMPVTTVPRWEQPFPRMDVVRDALSLGADKVLRIVQQLKTQVYRMLVGDELRILKVARYYDPECHKVLAENDGRPMAPAIVAHAEVFGWHLVLMEDLTQHWSLSQVIQEVDVRRVHGLRTRPELEATLQQLLAPLHDKGIVFGDFRPPNIMLRLERFRDDADTEVAYKAVDLHLVDFELSGKVGQPRPPVKLNAKAFSEGVVDCTSGDVKHALDQDTDMIERIWKVYVEKEDEDE